MSEKEAACVLGYFLCPCSILGEGRMAVFIVYFELAGTSMLSVGRPGFVAGVLPATTLFKLRMSACQEGIFFVLMWRRACLVRWSLRMNRRSHTGQTNFFSPVCVRRCLDSSSERANLLSQPSQLQLKGFSPMLGRQTGRVCWVSKWVTSRSSKSFMHHSASS